MSASRSLSGFLLEVPERVENPMPFLRNVSRRCSTTGMRAATGRDLAKRDCLAIEMRREQDYVRVLQGFENDNAFQPVRLSITVIVQEKVMLQETVMLFLQSLCERKGRREERKTARLIWRILVVNVFRPNAHMRYDAHKKSNRS